LKCEKPYYFEQENAKTLVATSSVEVKFFSGISKMKFWHDLKGTRYLLTQFGAMSPTSGATKPGIKSTIIV